jgi:hypothetical protein
MEEVEGWWRRLHNDKIGGECSTHTRDERVIQYFGRETEEKGTFGRIRRR